MTKKEVKRLREVPTKRDLFSKHYLNEDGSFTAEISISPIHYKDEDDFHHDISLELFDENDFDQVDFKVTKEKRASFKAKKEIAIGAKKKSAQMEPGDLHGLKVPFDATFPANFKKGYSIGKGSSRLTFKPEGAAAAKAEKVSSNKVRYPGAWTGSDVILELIEKGIKETIVLHDESAPNIFSFEVTGPLKDDFTAGDLQMKPAWLVDASGVHRDVQTNIRRQGARVFVDLVADVYGLSYPIEIDPTVTIQPDGAAGKDVPIFGYSPSLNSGTNTNLYSGITSGYPVRSLLQFDLSSMPEAPSVSSANLMIYKSGGSNQSINIVDVHNVTSAWSESTVTWQNQPSFNATLAATFGGGFTNDVWYKWDITNLAKDWKSGSTSNNGVVLKQRDETGSSRYDYFSSDYSNVELRPKLVIEYDDPPTAPTVTSPKSGDIWNESHTIQWISGIDKEYSVKNDFDFTTTNGNVNAGAGYKQAIIISSSKDATIEKIEFSGYTTGTTATHEIQLWSVGAGGYPSTLIGLIGSHTLPSGGKATHIVDGLNTQINANTDYAIVFDHVGGDASYLSYKSPAPGYDRYVQTESTGGWEWLPDEGLAVKVHTMSLNSVQHQIEYRQVGQAAWYSIVSLTSLGATSYNYDFSSIASGMYNLRIRAYDGKSYGAWATSDTFEIKHNTAPTAPTPLSPLGTSTSPGVATSLTPSVSWSFNDSDSGDAQSAYQVLVYDAAGVLKHDSGKKTGSATSYTIPASVLAWKTKYYWRVRVYDTKGPAVSPYSTSQWFLTNQGPTANITNPSATSGVGTVFNDTLQPTFTWTYSDADGDGQSAVQILIKDGSTTVFDSGTLTTTGSSYQIPSTAGVIYDKTYTTQIRARDVNNTWGSYSSLKYFHLNRSPGVPTNLSPSGTSANPAILLDNLTPVISWTFSDPDSTDSQIYAYVRIREESGNVVYTGGFEITTQQIQIPSGHLLSGKKYYFEVTYKDQHGYYPGGYTVASEAIQYASLNESYFYTNASPDTPTNQSPAGGSAAAPATVLDDLTPTLSWLFNDQNSGDTQKSFQVKVYNEAGTLLHDSGEVVSSAQSYEIPAAYKLTYSQNYQWEVRTKDQLDAWSNYTPRGWITPKVGAPSGLSAAADNFGAKIILDWTDSLAENLQGYNVYRSTSLDGTYTKINGTLVTESKYNDSQVSTGITYYYKVEAYVNSTEISPLSSAVSAAAIFSSWFIGSFKFIGPSNLGATRTRAQSKRAVLGKSKRVIQDRGFLGEILDLQIILSNDEYSTGKEKYDELMAELEKTEPLSVRDPFGQVWKVSPGEVTWELLTGTGNLSYKVSFPLEEVN
jgi:hypothetical protein